MESNSAAQNRRKVARILDAPLSPTARRIAVSMLDAKSVKEVAEDAGTSEKYVYKAGARGGIMDASAAQIMKKKQELDNILTMLDNILDKDAETPLKYSDKIAAAKLKSEILGATSKKVGDTYNVGVFDLREATEEQLLSELERIERQKREALDAEAIDVTDSITM